MKAKIFVNAPGSYSSYISSRRGAEAEEDLSTVEPSEDSARSEAVRLALRELGYTEGQNISTEYQYAEGKLDRYPELAAELVRLKVDVIVVGGGSAMVRAAKNATKTIPIVMMGAAPDPVEAGLVESLARPGGNVTGLTSLSRDLDGKRLELLKEAVTKIFRLPVLYDSASPIGAHAVKQDLPVAARASLNKQRPDGLYVPSGALMGANQKRTIGFALKSRLPSMYNNTEDADAGGLMSYGADLADSYRRVAYFVDRILKGAKPADLPVEQPTKFEMVINLNTAKHIGLTIPQSMLYRADSDRVILQKGQLPGRRPLVI